MLCVFLMKTPPEFARTWDQILIKYLSTIRKITIKPLGNKQLLSKVSSTVEFARTWGRMKANRSEEMNYEKVSEKYFYLKNMNYEKVSKKYFNQ